MKQNEDTNTVTNAKSEDDSVLGGIITLGLIGGGYYGIKKHKKNKR